MVSQRRIGQRILVLFLGSTIGNFPGGADTDFLRDVRAALHPGDALLVGTDLEKPADRLVAAYDDALGVTAAFNLNLLVRINRELAADFALDGFEHLARYNPATRNIEMHLRSRREQRVVIPRAGFSLVIGKHETIWTETSHKYTLREVEKLAKEAGFQQEAQWVDADWPFAETLLLAV